MTGPFGWLTTKLRDAAQRVRQRQLSGRRWGDGGAIRRYRRRVAEQLRTVSIPFDLPFDLPLPEAYVPVRVAVGDPADEADDAAAGHDLLDPVTVVAHRRGTLVLGPPGAGKSTLLRYLHWSSCTGARAELGRRLAVEVALSRVDQLDDVTGALVEAFERFGLRDADRFVRRELGGSVSNLTVLFDGLDEVGRDRRAAVARLVAGFTAQNPSVKFVVTCRTQAYQGALDGAVDQTVHLRPLSDDLVAQFLRAWPATTLPGANGSLVGAVQGTPWLATLARNPLVLTKLAVLHSASGDLLPDRRRVCREVADLLLARWKPEHNRERADVRKAVLQHLAADAPSPDADPRGMRDEEALAEVRVVLARHDREPSAAAAVLDEIVERSGLLVRAGGGERYRFAHAVLQEYFLDAAEVPDRPNEVLRRDRSDREALRTVLPQAVDVLARGAGQEEKVLPHLERMGPGAVSQLAGLDTSGPRSAGKVRDRVGDAGPSPGASPDRPAASAEPFEPSAPSKPSKPSRLRGRRVPLGLAGRGAAVPVAAAVALCLGVALVVVMTRSSGDGEGPVGDAAEGAMQLVWSTPQAHVASQPVLAGGNVVAHVVDGDGLALVAYDPESGEEVWRRPSTASQVPAGVVLSVVSDGARVVHMSPRDGDGAVVEAVDAGTGDPFWQTDEASGGFGELLRFCGDDSVCVGAIVDGAFQRWTIDAASGELADDAAADVAGFRRPPTTQQPIEGRSLGHGLVDLYPSRDIALVVDGQVIWQRPPSELFGGLDVSPDHGWSWRTTGDLLVGTLGTVADIPDDGSAEVVPQYMAGIDAATGEMVWVAEGDPHCGGRLTSLNLRVGGGAQPWLRCWMTGTLDREDGRVTGAEVDAVMEGFDPATGEAIWTVELPGASGLYVDGPPLVRFGPASFALGLDDGTRVALDVATGQAVDARSDTVGWCYTDNTYRQADGPDAARIGPDFATPCDLTGELRRTPDEPDDAVGLRVDGRFVWMDATGLHAARPRD